MKPLIDQLGRVKDLTVPEFGSLQAWELQNAVGRAANGDHENDPSKSSQGFGFGGTPMPYVGETKVSSSSAFYPFTYKITNFLCYSCFYFHLLEQSGELKMKHGLHISMSVLGALIIISN